MGWAGIENGELLRKGVEAGFDVLVESLDPHFSHKDASDARGVDSVLTVRRLGRTLPASTCASERADIAVARP